MNNLFPIYKLQFLLALKQLKEYKADFYMGLLTYTVTTLSYFVFYIVFQELSAEILNWTYYDFMLFFFIGMLTSLALRFFWVRPLVNIVKHGNLNTVLSKPVKPYFFIIIADLRGSFIPFTFIFLLIVISMSFFESSYSNHFLASLILIIGFIVQILFLNIIFSLAFFTKGLVNYLFKLYYQNLNTLIEAYTPKFFESSKFVHIIYLFPVSFIDYFFIEILKGNTETMFFYLPYFLLFGLICLIILIIQWKVGLKKYEAFG